MLYNQTTNNPNNLNSRPPLNTTKKAPNYYFPRIEKNENQKVQNNNKNEKTLEKTIKEIDPLQTHFANNQNYKLSNKTNENYLKNFLKQKVLAAPVFVEKQSNLFQIVTREIKRGDVFIIPNSLLTITYIETTRN